MLKMEWIDTIAQLVSHIESETKVALVGINDNFCPPPFNSYFREKFLGLMQKRVSQVYDTYMLHLELEKQLAQKFSAKDDTIALFADWKPPTEQNVISSQKRKFEDDGANDQTFLIKKPRFEIHKEVLSNSGDNETFDISDDETNTFLYKLCLRKSKTLESNSNSVSSFHNITDDRPEIESKLFGTTNNSQSASISTRVDSPSTESFADQTAAEQVKALPKLILTQTSTPLSVATKPMTRSIENIAPKTALAPTAASVESSKQQSVTSTKDVEPAKMSTRAMSEVSNRNMGSTSIENSINMTSMNETDLSTASNNEIKFVCGQCDYSSKHKYRFVRHENSHKKNPFQCKSCPRRFSSKDVLEMHQIEHEKPEPFCGKCQVKFVNYYNLKRHMKNAHNQDKMFV